MVKPKLKTRSLLQEYSKVAKEYSAVIAKYEPVGITLGGGLSRGHADKHSEIDLYIYLTPQQFKKWKKKAPIPEYDHEWRGYWIDTEFINIKEVKESDWTLNLRWEKQYNKILYDPLGKVKELLKEKVKWYPRELEQVKKEAVGMARWFTYYLPKTWIERGDLVQAHYSLNKAISWIADIVFLENKYFIPYGKWKMHFAFLMKKKPKNFSKLKDAMLMQKYTEEEVLRRQKILISILKEMGIKPKEELGKMS